MKCIFRLYFHTAPNDDGQRGQMTETFVHGELSVSIAAEHLYMENSAFLLQLTSKQNVEDLDNKIFDG